MFCQGRKSSKKQCRNKNKLKSKIKSSESELYNTQIKSKSSDSELCITQTLQDDIKKLKELNSKIKKELNSDFNNFSLDTIQEENEMNSNLELELENSNKIKNLKNKLRNLRKAYIH